MGRASERVVEVTVCHFVCHYCFSYKILLDFSIIFIRIVRIYILNAIVSSYILCCVRTLATFYVLSAQREKGKNDCVALCAVSAKKIVC